ncbi:hypothetical protein O3G_MSEX011657 [Manduca sexta]|uniref:C2H2-type domain-containing protein n=1 Tax=Manduca sexta TaxID=7130 RepID=A0A921ZLR9_MANSE|nr:hypothetical protein O3G_MSEX011657 [Manduca sexta]
MSYFIELNLPAYNADAEILGSFPEAVCVCCLARNVPYVNLASCKHTEYLESFFKYKAEFPNTVCYVCHEMLRKIDAFKQQVEDSTLILNKEVLNMKKHKLHNLQSSPVKITVDIIPEITNDVLKNELTLPPEADIKEETDTSDFETEMPLSMIKKQKEMKDLVKKELTLIIKNERLDPSPFMDGKYVGKLKMHLLTREELEKERELLRTEEKYQKLPFKCESCIIGFNREMYLKKHLRQRHKAEIGSYTCDICKSVFSTEISLKPHHRRHFIRYDCKVCGKRYIDERAIVSHYNEKHGKDGATVHNKFKCKLEECGFETHSYRSFMYHRSKHERYPCTMCDKVYSKWIQLRSHIYGVHRKKQTTFPCKKCDKVYKQSCGLRIHMQSVHNTTDRLPYCAPCRMHFRTSHNLKQHLRQHSNHITDADKK